jgi:membrane protein implicated in regulation of membrane protease activity
MYLIAIAWAYVALMMAAAEALSPQGTLFGAFITLMLYGILPLGLLLYILGTPGRRRRRRAAETSSQTDAGGHAAAGPAQVLTPEREE